MVSGKSQVVSNSSKREWFQIVSNIAVLVGLVVLIYEVNQSNLYAHAANASTNFALSSDRDISLAGEDVSVALAKALDDPASLTTQELLVVDAHHRKFLTELNHASYLGDLGVFPTGWEEDYGNYIREHLDYPFGRKWWSLKREGLATADGVFTAQIIDSALADSENSRSRFFEDLSAEE
jgi:hypothetical protein